MLLRRVAFALSDSGQTKNGRQFQFGSLWSSMVILQISQFRSSMQVYGKQSRSDAQSLSKLNPLKREIIQRPYNDRQSASDISVYFPKESHFP